MWCSADFKVSWCGVYFCLAKYQPPMLFLPCLSLILKLQKAECSLSLHLGAGTHSYNTVPVRETKAEVWRAESSSEKSVSLCNSSPRTSILLPCLRVWISGPKAAFLGPQTWHRIRMSAASQGQQNSAENLYFQMLHFAGHKNLPGPWTTAHWIPCYLQLKQLLRRLVRKGERGRGGGSREQGGRHIHTTHTYTYIHTRRERETETTETETGKEGKKKEGVVLLS